MESTPNAYTIERYTAEMDAVAYIEGFHDTGYFIKFRQQCEMSKKTTYQLP